MRRVWAEFLSAREVAGRLDLLARHAVSPCLAVKRWSPGLADLLRESSRRGLEPALWPLLPLEEGYFPSENNLGRFGRLVRELVEGAARERADPCWMAVDLEPPLNWGLEILRGPALRRVSRILRWPLDTLQPERFERARRALSRLIRDLHDGGWKVLCAAAPQLLDEPVETAGLEDLLETPVFGLEWDRVSFMLYSSMAPGLGSARGNPAYVHSYAREARRRLGRAAAVSVGVTGRGILQMETPMAGPEVLARDVAAARAAGVEDIALYNLEGSLRDPEGWLGALEAPPADPGRSARVDASRAAVRAAAQFLETVRRRLR